MHSRRSARVAPMSSRLASTPCHPAVRIASMVRRRSPERSPPSPHADRSSVSRMLWCDGAVPCRVMVDVRARASVMKRERTSPSSPCERRKRSVMTVPKSQNHTHLHTHSQFRHSSPAAPQVNLPLSPFAVEWWSGVSPALHTFRWSLRDAMGPAPQLDGGRNSTQCNHVYN